MKEAAQRSCWEAKARYSYDAAFVVWSAHCHPDVSLIVMIVLSLLVSTAVHVSFWTPLPPGQFHLVHLQLYYLPCHGSPVRASRGGEAQQCFARFGRRRSLAFRMAAPVWTEVDFSRQHCTEVPYGDAIHEGVRLSGGLPLLKPFISSQTRVSVKSAASNAPDG
ncbi:hypothetical protein V8E51_004761 [Hyaloscypha variabilis]